MSLLPPVSNPLLYTTDVSGAAQAAVQAADIAAQAGEPAATEPSSPDDVANETGLAPMSSGSLKILLEAQRDYAATQLLPDDPSTPLIESSSLRRLL